jgi:hypothetical protein
MGLSKADAYHYAGYVHKAASNLERSAKYLSYLNLDAIAIALIHARIPDKIAYVIAAIIYTAL